MLTREKMRQYKAKSRSNLLAKHSAMALRLWRINADARKSGDEGELKIEEWEALLAECGNKCLRCGRSGDKVQIVPDHVIPRSKGGPNVISNIQPLCRGCNSSKNNGDTDYRDTAQTAEFREFDRLRLAKFLTFQQIADHLRTELGEKKRSNRSVQLLIQRGTDKYPVLKVLAALFGTSVEEMYQMLKPK